MASKRIQKELLVSWIAVDRHGKKEWKRILGEGVFFFKGRGLLWRGNLNFI